MQDAHGADGVLRDPRLHARVREYRATRKVSGRGEHLDLRPRVLKADRQSPRDAAGARATGIHRQVAEDFDEWRDRDAARVFARTHDGDLGDQVRVAAAARGDPITEFRRVVHTYRRLLDE